MPTRQERLNYAIAAARASNSSVNDVSLSGLGSKCVACSYCDGTGLPQNNSFRHIEFCKACNGKGYVSVAQPRKPKFDYELPIKKESNGNNR